MNDFIPRILIDMDSVIYDIITPWIALYNNDYPNHKVSYQDCKEWDMTKTVCTDCGPKIFDYLKYEPCVYSEGDMISESLDVTNSWHRKGYELAIVTSCIGNIAAEYKAGWLDYHFPHIKNRIYIQGNHIKHWISADVMIDDAPHNLEEFSGFKILFDQPWNQNYNKDDVLRCRNWLEVELAVTYWIKDFEQCLSGSAQFFSDETLIAFIKERLK